MPVAPTDLVCFSHLRWSDVFQRPHHLMSRAARDRRVFFVEEPNVTERPRLTISSDPSGVVTVVPGVPDGLAPDARRAVLTELIDRLVATEGIEQPRLWYYTPVPIAWTRHLDASAVVFDVMDELSAFRNPPSGLLERERELLGQADVVFTGGRSLYEAKRGRHHNVHAFPSAVDVAHFARARQPLAEPDEQRAIPAPRLGWFGVIDERLDLELIDGVAAARPEWSIVLVGPVAKIDPCSIPSRPNVYVMGRRTYAELPAWLSGWDVAVMPFARNGATRFISPTKTPEYLAGGRPVVSTSIRDVVQPYGELGLVRIADTPPAFVAACEAAMAEDPAARLAATDAFLADLSWDRTWAAMDALADRAVRQPGLARQAGRALRRVVSTSVAASSSSPAAAAVPATSRSGALDRRRAAGRTGR